MDTYTQCDVCPYRLDCCKEGRLIEFIMMGDEDIKHYINEKRCPIKEKEIEEYGKNF